MEALSYGVLPSISSMVPYEIWRECWLHASASDLASLSTVCSWFSSICRPLLFRDVATFSVKNYPHEGNKAEKRAFLESLKNRFTNLPSEHLCQMARTSVNFGSYEITAASGILPELYYDALDLFISALPSFPSISSIHLQSIDISLDVCISLSALKSLRHLRIQDCDIFHGVSHPLMELDSFASQGSKAYRDEFARPQFDESVTLLRMFSPRKIKHLCLDHETVSKAFINARHPSTYYPLLTSLSINASEVCNDELISLLDHCPELRSFTMLGGARGRSDMTSDLPSSSIPHLTTYRGPHRFARAVVPGRPVDVVVFNDLSSDDYDGVSDSLAALTGSTVPIRHLEIQGLSRLRDSLFAKIFRVFSSLQKLVLGSDVQNVVVQQSEEPMDVEEE